MPQIMTTNEIAEYLKLHEITICKYAAEGTIPAIRIGRKWRFEKGIIDQWLTEGGTHNPGGRKPAEGKATKKTKNQPR